MSGLVLLTHVHSIRCLSASGVGRSSLFSTLLMLVNGVNDDRLRMGVWTREKCKLGGFVSAARLTVGLRGSRRPSRSCCSPSRALSGEYEKFIKSRRDQVAACLGFIRLLKFGISVGLSKPVSRSSPDGVLERKNVGRKRWTID
jgi:hypothetical protein